MEMAPEECYARIMLALNLGTAASIGVNAATNERIDRRQRFAFKLMIRAGKWGSMSTGMRAACYAYKLATVGMQGGVRKAVFNPAAPTVFTGHDGMGIKAEWVPDGEVPAHLALYVQHVFTGAWCIAGTADPAALYEWLGKKLKR